MDRQVVTTEPKSIYCEATQKLLARMDEHGIYLWCKACRQEHRITFTATSTDAANWQEMQKHFMPV